MESAKTKRRRCALYTRKSSEEGLEQDFNSLHAQREACEAFVRSQAGEGWRIVQTEYNDGGFSGGTVERPALQRLLADIREGLVDIIVVYKVDRLTRSLADFAKMVELFDAHGVSFVAVTQQFNTTTSMGRLTLNVLLSFAQFEREVTGERIRDKIAASKRKGMWMGGIPPLGYDVHERRLVVNTAEADTVRKIFGRYLDLGCVRSLKNELDQQGIVSKVRVSRSGNRSGGKPFSRGALYELLSNPVGIGEIRHKHDRYPGQHEAIVDRELWERVQQRLTDQAARKGSGGPSQVITSPLTGKLFDEGDEPLYVQWTAKGKRRYRYYVSRALVRGSEETTTRPGWRVPAAELEKTVRAISHELLTDRAAIATAIEEEGTDPSNLPSVLNAAVKWDERLSSVDSASVLAEVTERVALRRDGIEITLKLPFASNAGSQESKTLSLTRLTPMQIRRRGVEMRMVADVSVLPARVDFPLLKVVARAYRWSDDLFSGRVQSVGEIAKREQLSSCYVWRIIRLGFLAPEIVEAIVAGRQPEGLTASSLTRRSDLPSSWKEQVQLLGEGSVDSRVPLASSS